MLPKLSTPSSRPPPRLRAVKRAPLRRRASSARPSATGKASANIACSEAAIGMPAAATCLSRMSIAPKPANTSSGHSQLRAPSAFVAVAAPDHGGQCQQAEGETSAACATSVPGRTAGRPRAATPAATAAAPRPNGRCPHGEPTCPAPGRSPAAAAPGRAARSGGRPAGAAVPARDAAPAPPALRRPGSSRPPSAARPGRSGGPASATPRPVRCTGCSGKGRAWWSVRKNR